MPNIHVVHPFHTVSIDSFSVEDTFRPLFMQISTFNFCSKWFNRKDVIIIWKGFPDPSFLNYPLFHEYEYTPPPSPSALFLKIFYPFPWTFFDNAKGTLKNSLWTQERFSVIYDLYTILNQLVLSAPFLNS